MKKERNEFGIALVGCGNITRQHCEAYRSHGLKVVGFYDPNPQACADRRREFFPEARIYESEDQLLNDAAVDIVDAAAHASVRQQTLINSIEAGKHLLSQKPFVVDLAKGKNLVASADAKGLQIAVNQNGRWSPGWKKVTELLSQGAIGDLRSISMASHWDHNWIVDSPGFADMHHVILYDFAIHWFDIVRVWAHEPWQSVSASLSHSKGQLAKPPLHAIAQVGFESIHATLEFNGNNTGKEWLTADLIGDEGTLSIRGDFGPRQIELTSPDAKISYPLSGHWFPDGFGGAMLELIDSLIENRAPSNSAADHLESLSLCLSACESADSGVTLGRDGSLCRSSSDVREQVA